MTETGLYIHIPFCKSKCFYCDFLSFTCSESLQSEYCDALSKELKIISEKYPDIKIDTVFVGGGTPSVLSYENAEKIFNSVYRYFKTEIKEFTVECNPCSFDKEKALFYKHNGVDRISLGIQSFDDNILKTIGRAHDGLTAKKALYVAKEYFSNINGDLIIGTMKGSRDGEIKSLKELISFDIQHISTYQLILERGTALYNKTEKKQFIPCSDDESAETYEKVTDILNKSHPRYEVSNFAEPGFECKHNFKYWNFDDYIGAGLSAHSFIQGYRKENTCDIKKYINDIKNKKTPYVRSQKISKKEGIKEYVITAFRTVRGIDMERFNNIFNENFIKYFSTALRKMKNYLDISDNYISIKPEYFNVQNSVIVEFI